MSVETVYENKQGSQPLSRQQKLEKSLKTSDLNTQSQATGIHFDAFEQAHRKHSAKQMPFLNELNEAAIKHRPYQGLKILHNIPLTVEAVLKIEPLLLGGAEVTVSCIQALAPEPEALAILKAAGVTVQLNHDFTDDYDVCLDCCAELMHLNPKLGTVELTQTGSELYKKNQHLTYPVISVDDSKLKYLETVFGTGDGFLRALLSHVKEEIYNREFLVFGYGKVGQGITRALLKYTDLITVVDPSEKAKKIAERKGLKILDSTSKPGVREALKEVYCVITATGVKHLLSDYYQLAKADCGQAYLINMGAEDEYGENFQASDVLYEKKPFNFSVEMPTLMKYLDPVFYAHNRAIDFLKSGNLSPGYYPLPVSFSEKVLDRWTFFHQEYLFDENIN